MSITQYAPQYWHPFRKVWVYRSRKPVLWSNNRLVAQKRALKWKKHGRLTRIVTREIGPF